MGILAAFIIALLVSLLFIPAYRRNGSSFGPILAFFFILFMAGVVAQFWIVPFGPSYWGVYWFPTIFFVLLLALIFMAPATYRRRRDNINANISASGTANMDAAETSAVVISAIVWLILIALLIAVVVGYFRDPGVATNVTGISAL